MKIGNSYVQFKCTSGPYYKDGAYKEIFGVPYWRIYDNVKCKSAERLPAWVSKVLSINELTRLCRGHHYSINAYARQTRATMYKYTDYSYIITDNKNFTIVEKSTGLLVLDYVNGKIFHKDSSVTDWGVRRLRYFVAKALLENNYEEPYVL